MIILGINAYHADASAAIFVDGKLVAAIEEERFKRIKHWAGFPAASIHFCLQEAGVSWEAVDFFAMGRDPGAKFLKKLLYLTRHPFGSWKGVKERLSNARKTTTLKGTLAQLSGLPAQTFSEKVINVEHHRSHLASAFFASPYEESALLSIDGSGDFTTTMTGVGHGNTLTVIDSVDFPHSIGLFYTAFTQLLGFEAYGDEYKVMGLAPYGKPTYVHRLDKILKATADGLFSLNLDFFKPATAGVISYNEKHQPQVATLFNKSLVEEFGLPRKKDEPLTQHHKDLAASVQAITEKTIFHLLTHLHKKTGLSTICIAGGVAQNSVANGKITAETPFTKVYIPSAGHDAGISLGAALYVQHEIQRLPRQKSILSAYTGSHFSNEEIKDVLIQNGVAFLEYSNEELFVKVTRCLVAGGVIGWFSGRSEFGPRALGARSIIADPRREDAKDIINSKIKRRESFRPFAPSILKEHVKDYFEVGDEVPFMEKVFPVKKEKHNVIPAVTHVDGTGRLQTVDRDISPRFYGLIETFFRHTEVPVLLNTSFNENEPIVNTPQEALACFLRTNMDMLVMENIIVERQHIREIEDKDSYATPHKVYP